MKGFTHGLGLHAHERRLLLLMGALVGTLSFAYTIAKVLRDALFLSEFGAVALPYAYLGVAVAAAAFVWVESVIARHFAQVGASRFNQYAAITLSAVAAAVFPIAPHWTIVGFYIWTGSQLMMILPHFWSLALDVWDSRRARTVFPLFGGCILIGGLAGGAFAAWLSPAVRDAGLMWTLCSLLGVAYVLTRFVERHRVGHTAPAETASTKSRWQIIMRSKYIKILALAIALSVIVSTLVDFQFKVFIQNIYPEQDELTRFLGKFYVGLNAISLLFQFSLAGWVLKRLGLGPATALQPITGMMFLACIMASPIWWAVVAMRWLQGVVFQTLGKSSVEIYYAAIHPRERSRIKPAIDTLVERWSDAVVGVLLIVMLHVLGVRSLVVAIVTVTLAVAWLVAVFLLNRQYGRAFEQILSTRWIEPETNPDAIRTPSARKALLEGLRDDDEQRIVLALRLSREARDPNIAGAVRKCLKHPSLAVRAAAVEAMRAMGVADPDDAINGFLSESNESLRRATVGYLLARSPQPVDFARQMLDGDDAVLRQYVVDVLFDRPNEARALTPQWIDQRMKSGSREDLLLAARAAGVMTGGASAQRLRTLLHVKDSEVQRMALLSARRRPNPELLDVLLPLMLVPELSHEAREAIAAIGDPAVPELDRLLAGGQGARGQALAARTLGRIATPLALQSLMKLVRTSDRMLRHFGLQSMYAVRIHEGKAVVPRRTAHQLFLRELADYRTNIGPSVRLETHAEKEVRLFAESFRESAEMALERALLALACWYEPRPLAGAFNHLRSREPQAAAPALEYLSHVLPGGIFRPVARIFEETKLEPEDDSVQRDEVAESIRAAWHSGDAWQRACAVRVARFAPTFDPKLFAAGSEDPLVMAELAAYSAGAQRMVGSASREGHSC